MPEFIPATLFRPPAYPYPYVQRERLQVRLRRAQSAKVVLIEGRGGFGKSMAGAELVHGLSAAAVWYPLEHLPRRDLSGFVWNLMKAVQSVCPWFGEDAARQMENLAQVEGYVRDDSWLYAGVLPGLAADFNRLARPVWLVLDNYHLLGDQAQFERLLTYLIENTRSHIHFVLATRETLCWQKREDWQACKKLSVIGESDLAFSPKDVQVFTSKLGLDFPDRMFNDATGQLKGQPFLFSLLVRFCRGKSEAQIAEILRVLADPRQSAADYLASVFIETQSQDVRDFCGVRHF